MTTNVRRMRRPGSVLPLAVLTMVSMCGFVALAIDLGVIAVAKTQCQNSADAAAMAGARSLDGTPGQNLGAVNTPGTSKYIAQNTALDNKVLTNSLLASNITLTYGAWHYDIPSQLFVPQFPPVAPDNYNLVQVDVSYSLRANFAGAFKYLPGNSGFSPLITVQASAQAAHRPRDVCMILDYSGSMNNESDLWNCEGYLDNGSNNTTNGYRWPKANNPAWTSNSAETVYPLFGHYAGTSATAQSTQGNDYSDYTANPNMLCPAAVGGSGVANNPLIGKSNVSNDLTSTLGIPHMVDDFYSNNRGSSVAYAFTSAGAGDAAGWVAGDKYLHMNGSTTTGAYAMNVNDIVNNGQTNASTNKYNSNWETQGYKKYTGTAFKGYTVGPNYWGKTFFIWPPDPTNDWRAKYFSPSSLGAAFDNTDFFQNGANFSGNRGVGYIDPAGNYIINYKAILAWIKNTSGTGNINPFPSQLRSGNVLVYGSIPSDVPAAAYDHTQPNSAITDPDQRFWKEYIDYTLGVWRAADGTIQHTFQPSCSIGPDFMYSSKGSIVASSAQFGTPGSPGSTVQIKARPGLQGVNQQYMDYLDNPWRPRHRMWFGPMTMIQFMSDCGYLPGTTHDISMFPMKQGVGGALLDIQNNHPNDLIGMLLFSRPVYGNDPPGIGSFNVPQYSLTNDYTSMLGSLWLPPNSGSSDIRLFGDPNAGLIPHAHGDFDANTASSFGFMLAYNQFSGNRGALVGVPGMDGSTPTTVGGLGRKGATRMVIFETDGMANEDSVPQNGITNGGAYNSYYNIRPTDKVDGANYDQNKLLQVVESICNRDDGTAVVVPSGYPTPPNVPGYATNNKPVLVHCIAFGAIFETPNSSQTSVVPMLQQVSTIGGTNFPSSSTDPVDGYKWCIGTLQQRQDKLKQAFLNILDSSVPVSLIK